jgi:hypothetical protein
MPDPLDLTTPGPWVAHYTTADAAFDHILPTGRLRMSPYRRMDDPLENQDFFLGMAYTGSGPPDEAGALFEAMGRVKDIRDGMRVLSLTRDVVRPSYQPSYGCCWARPRMWQQYAEAHRGACLVFDQAELESELTGQLGRLGTYYHGEVQYSPGGFYSSAAKTITEPAILNPSTRARALERYVETYHQDFFFLKDEDWATEYEYRYVLLLPSDEYAHVDYGSALKAVVVGDKFLLWHWLAARTVCDSASVELRRMRWEGGHLFATTRPPNLATAPSA